MDCRLCVAACPVGVRTPLTTAPGSPIPRAPSCARA
ncbi:hypothetical protein ACH47Z_45525 [Streptomyces sp. NPDC020192]